MRGGEKSIAPVGFVYCGQTEWGYSVENRERQIVVFLCANCWDGSNSGADITRTGPDSFNLAQIGTYQVLFQVSVTEAGQLILTLNGEDLEYTVAGRATGASQIVGMAIVTTTAINSVLTVRNPTGNAAALTITPVAGGPRSVSAH